MSALTNSSREPFHQVTATNGRTVSAAIVEIKELYEPGFAIYLDHPQELERALPDITTAVGNQARTFHNLISDLSEDNANRLEDIRFKDLPRSNRKVRAAKGDVESYVAERLTLEVGERLQYVKKCERAAKSRLQRAKDQNFKSRAEKEMRELLKGDFMKEGGRIATVMVASRGLRTY